MTLGGARLSELTLALALMLPAALIWSAGVGAVYSLARIGHGLVERLGIPIGPVVPGLVIFFLAGYPGALWLAHFLFSDSVMGSLGVGAGVAVSCLLVGVMLLWYFPTLQGTTGFFALCAVAVSRLILFPFEKRVGLEEWGPAVAMVAAGTLLSVGFYATFRARFAYHTAGQLQTRLPRRSAWVVGVVLTVMLWAAFVALGVRLPVRLTHEAGALWSLAGLVVALLGALAAMWTMLMAGAAWRLARKEPPDGRSGYWFAPACILFVVSALLHLSANPARVSQSAFLRGHGLLSYDLLALARGSLGQARLPEPPVWSDRIPVNAQSIDGRRPETIIMLTVLKSHGLPATAELTPMFLGTDRSEEALQRLVGNTQGHTRAQGFAAAGFRTICGGWAGGQRYLETGHGNLHHGCQVHIPLAPEARSPDFPQTIKAMTLALRAYREERTFLWIHYEGSLVRADQVEQALSQLRTLGKATLVVTEQREPAMAYVTPAQSRDGELQTQEKGSGVDWIGRLSEEFRPSPLLVYRGAFGKLPDVIAGVEGNRLHLFDPAGGARWERTLMLPGRAAAGLEKHGSGKPAPERRP